jgi:acetyl-CoA carboxylase alpha subunit
VAGADLGGGQEVAGLAGEVARVTDELLHLPCPTVAVLCGQGGGGAALALLAADRVVAVPESWLAPIGPEAASVILWGTTAGAEAVADAQQVGAVEQVGKGLVDRVVPADGLAAAVGAELDHLATVPAADRLRRRADRFRSLGRSSCDLGAPLAQAPVDPLP